MNYPPFNGQRAQLPQSASTARVNAECKRLIEEAWRRVGVQVLVVVDGVAIRSDLRGGLGGEG
jgi:hypothetical protein